MEELKIDIIILTQKRNEKQCEIADFFKCRFPKDEEFRLIKPKVEEILILEAKIDALTDLFETIESNLKEPNEKSI